MTLDELNLEEPARVSEVGGQGALRRRLLDMGITPGTEVMIRKRAPMGDPIEIHLRGYELTLRIEDAKKKFKWRRSGSNDFCIRRQSKQRENYPV
ncbi:MAG: FeoA family protein [[Clostridium] leptum]